MRNRPFDPHEFIEQVAALSRADHLVPDPDKGIGRQCYAFSQQEDHVFRFAEREIRDILRDRAEGRDYLIARDPIGNLFVTLSGRISSLSPFMMHSHLDSVQEGGTYDGVAGVAVALDVLNDIVCAGEQPVRSFRVGIYRSEESSPRNGVGCLGSAIATGTISVEQLSRIDYTRDKKLSALFTNEQWQKILASVERPSVTRMNTVASLELHIEQSSLIARNNAAFGIVTDGIGGACRQRVHVPLQPHRVLSPMCRMEILQLEFRGTADHTGGTPPNPSFFSDAYLYRKDALVGSCYLVSRLLRKHILALVESKYARESGFTSIPSHQVVWLATTNSQVDDILSSIDDLGTQVESLLGVKVLARRTDGGTGIETVDHARVRRYLNLPLVVSALSMKALWREAAAFGTTRATTTDFRLSPREFSFKLDLREVNLEDFARLKSDVERTITKTLGSSALVPVSQKKSQPVDPGLVGKLCRIAERLGIPYIKMPSLPGHDSDRHSEAGIPVAMLFIRQNDGVSHSPYERMINADLDAAACVAKEFARSMLSQ